jgi:6-pyruvoyltetrahydropterin/6-carboxytetrahydropterin synthase
MPNYSIRVDSTDLVFSAAHFITFDDGGCEPLHGHDYRVKAELFGPLGTNEYVVDFVQVKASLKSIIEELDHRVLLPGDHPSIKIEPQGDQCSISYAGRRWILPLDNCRILPIGNTTTEMFAQYIGQQLIHGLVSKKRFSITEICVEVCECDGFAAVYRWKNESQDF